MDGELEEMATSSMTCSTHVSNPSVHVLNGQIFNVSIGDLTEDGDKTDYSTAMKFDSVATADLLPTDVVSVIGVDNSSSPSGLVLSVGDGMTIRNVALGDNQVSLADGQVSLASVTNSTDLHNTATHYLVHADLDADGARSQLFEVDNGQIDCTQLAITNSDNLQLISTEADAQPPPKRKGGWPKGRKRKKEKKLLGPKAPASAYVIYAIERRRKIKEMTPDLPFIEVTKVLGNEWSCMCPLEKQKYFDLAEEDKRRYIEQLQVYQQSDEYQSYLKRKRLKALCNDENGMGPMDGCNFLDDLEEEGLYCKPCNQYFSSAHNRKEHLFGKQHLQNVTSEFQAEYDRQEPSSRDASRDVSSRTSDELASELLAEQSLTGQEFVSGDGADQSGAPDVNGFIHQFMQQNYERELECAHLRKVVAISRDHNFELIEKIKELQDLELKLQTELSTAKSITAALNTQIDALRMVPTLFGVMNF